MNGWIKFKFIHGLRLDFKFTCKAMNEGEGEGGNAKPAQRKARTTMREFVMSLLCSCFLGEEKMWSGVG